MINATKSKVRTRVLFVPRASTELDGQNRFCGSLESPLSEEGLQQANQWAIALQDVDFSCLAVAAGIADKQTADVIVGGRKLKIRVESTWRNLDLGLWHGECIDHLKENHARFYRQWQENPESVSPPSGETVSELIARVKPAFTKLLKRRAGETFAIVAPEPLLSVLKNLALESHCECPSWEVSATSGPPDRN